MSDRQGRYTSLGSTFNTFPNPALRVPCSPDSAHSFPTSLVIVADNPSTTCTAEKPAVPPRIAHAFGPLTVIANNPEGICTAENSSDGGPHCLRVIADDPSTTCRVECAPAPPSSTGGEHWRQPGAFRYRPACELTDGSLERAGRLSGASVLADSAVP